MRHLLPLASAILLSAASAAQAASFSYDYLEGGFGEASSKGNRDGDVIWLGGAKALDSKFGLLGSFGIVDYNGSDGMVLRGGGLYRQSLQKDLDLFATLELVYSDYEFGPFSDSDIGLAAAGGLRYAVQDNFQIEGKLTLTEVEPFDDGLGLQVGARYFMDKQLSAAAGIASDADYDGIYVNLRYQLK
jgi:hypothetical protein